MAPVKQHRLRTTLMLTLLLVAGAARPAAAQGDDSSGVTDVIRGVVFDPTTYAPALISDDATMRDWKTSQPFFRHGFLERNERFTVSGRPNDTAVSYAVGRNRILRDTMVTLGTSAVQNVSSRLVERCSWRGIRNAER